MMVAINNLCRGGRQDEVARTARSAAIDPGCAIAEWNARGA
jgi:hypothetical protein